MPAVRGINLRSGDLAEQVGFLLLQSVALIAPVPRTEDIGIDAVVTLIKKHDSHRYIAEDTFLVQIKSASVTVLSYRNEEIGWLTDLQLPLFIASVERKTSTIKLYSTQSLSDALVANPKRSEINFHLDKIYEDDITDTALAIDVPIGPAVIEWSFETIESKPHFIDEFYKLMKAHVALAKKSIETRRVGYVDLATWNTGELPKVHASKMNLMGNTLEIDKTVAPYLTTFMNRLAVSDDLLTTRSLYRLLEKILDGKGHFQIVDGKKELIPWTAPTELKGK